MAYKQVQGRSEFSKTGRGITSKLAGPEDPPKDLRTTAGLERRLKQVGTNITSGKAEAGGSFNQIERLYNIAKGNNVKGNYEGYKKDSTAAANSTPYKYLNNSQEKAVGEKIIRQSSGFFDGLLDK
jgi:hypothetical protein